MAELPASPGAVSEPLPEVLLSVAEATMATEAQPTSTHPADKKTSAWKERGSRNLTYEERRSMLDFLMKRRVEGTTKLVRHAVTDAANEFGVDRRTVSRLWKRAVQSLENGDEVCDIASRKVGRRGRRKRDWSAELERVKEIPLAQRGSIRALATAVGIPKTTLYELLKEDGKPTINSIKPSLTDKNKLERLRYCSSKVRPNGLFDDMHNVVHINMKWFSLPRDKKIKVMFMAAVARPQWDPQKNEYFDGKIGTWPFVREEVQVQDVDMKSSHQIPERAFVALETVTNDDVQRMITELIVPAIRQKMPVHLMQGAIYIQQDSAKIRSSGDAMFAEEGRKEGWNIQMQSLPPYSPDFTVMENNLFKPIQAALKMPPPSTLVASVSGLTELMSGVERGFASLTRDQINDAFLALQKAMECTMRVQGSNTYELGPTGKEQLQFDGSLPVSILCDPNAISACRAVLDEATEDVLETF
ncbi:hypothetical protein PF005_g10499 [Phytophthora fragariae]|nr:hypothetical protein PF009_g11586 [Phytophthora fragariae]KAE9113484.1 hypothetical protein PF007_g10729 [Phytophthora fragariae]KAE9212666.1 hypothetical protein PF005_g10499 [Phytophthora fragariae]KAE9234137.1 hypothetical protein PF002_g11887 [Phytophthora fragariae]KAE9311323.1 hypothetical protein PF001_g9772 [Phytophthora fragariae]